MLAVCPLDLPAGPTFLETSVTLRPFGFSLEQTANNSMARAGNLHTRRGDVPTPVFMPVGTNATVRTQSYETLKAVGSHIVLGNTWHLMRQPGPEVFEHFGGSQGGIHRFTGWEGAFLTDSGGFQIFSLSHQLEVLETGARFRTHPDRPPILLTPELSMAMQHAIGADILMVLDHCIPSTADHATARAAMERTTRWAQRSLEAHQQFQASGSDSVSRQALPDNALPGQALFGIVQGACFPDLREESARAITALPFDGFAIGGLAVGETREQRETFTALTTSFLPPDRPRYLMGVGKPIDLLEAVHRGVDMFDCVLPQALAARGVAWTMTGERKLRRTAYRLDESPLEPGCPCPTCATSSRAWLHHLIKAEEVLGWQLIATHNIAFCHRLMATLRAAILEGTFVETLEMLRVSLLTPEEGSHAPALPRKKRTKTPHIE